MKKLLAKTLFFVILISPLGGGFINPTPARADFNLVKSKDFGTVYFIDGNSVRHPFSNLATYQSWYGADYSKITTVDNKFLANFKLGQNITIRPGTYLVKVPTAPQVYAVEPGGVLRELQNESIAASIYGEAWSKRVVDVADVFFGDYQIGTIINHDFQFPNGSLYQDSKNKKYYYVRNGILEPFATTQAVIDNHFKLSDAVSGSRDFFIREREIKTLDKNIFNLTAEPIISRRDCENQNLKAAVIFLTDGKYNTSEVEKIEMLKQHTPNRYAWASAGLSKISFNYPTAIINNDGYLLNKRFDGTSEIKNETINTFYDNNSDDFDFIFIFTNFEIPSEKNSNEIAHFTPVTNKVEGINRGNLDRSNIFGSEGKLKGVIVMGNINKYAPETSDGLSSALNIMVHEILHNWAAYVPFIDAGGKKNTNLLRADDESHWNLYDIFMSPLGGSGWIDNGNNTFTSALTKMADTNLRPFSQLDLYLMGLLPAQFVSPVKYLKPVHTGEVANTIEATVQTVAIDQIIKANGTWKCSLD
ncbi:MAG: hypothetical protein PHW95_03650 [Patescibacteria group bacterium]|nr:hypothetical protein [Patescibacteria group bacterium]